MSAPQPINQPIAATAALIGSPTPILLGLKKHLLSLNIKVDHIEKNISENIASYAYIWYFLPEKNLLQENYKKIQQILKEILARIENKSSKIAVIMRHPNEYYWLKNAAESFPININSDEVIRLHNHLLECIEEVKKTPKANSRIIAVNGVLSSNSNKDTPLLTELPFTGLPEKIWETNTGNEIVSPISVHLAVKEIIKATFSQHSKHQVYEIKGAKYTTISGLAFEIGKLKRLSGAISQKQEIVMQKLHFPATQIKVDNTNDLSSLIKELIDDSVLIKKQQQITQRINLPTPSVARVVSSPTPPINNSFQKKIIKHKSEEVKKRQKIHPGTYLILIIISASLLMFLLSPFVYFVLVKKTISHLEKLDTQKAEIISNYAKKTFIIAEKATGLYLPIVKFFDRGISRDDMRALINASNQSMKIAGELEQIKQSGKKIISFMVGDQKGDISGELEVSKQKVQSVYEMVNATKAIIKTIQLGDLESQTKNYIEKMEEITQEGSAYLEDALSMLNITDELFGLKESKSYLVLLQNNHELRATGGFIGSFAIVTMDKGKLVDIETYDVYSADGQLRGHVEPPKALRIHLGEANWYLRDSNWDPNFPTTARRAEWFLNKELGRQVDGTIAIDLFVVRDILGSLGGVELPDYNETINESNLFERAEFHSELNYFEGSTQKKDFISALVNALYLELSESKDDEGIKIISSLIKNAKQSHLQISLRKDSEESSLENSIFSGKVKEVRCQNAENPCLKDYFGVVESNVGVNKVNYFIQRAISHQIKVGAQSTNATTSLFLKNTAQSSAWPAGSYKNYIRFVIPSEASVESIKIDDQALQATVLEVEVRHGKKYVGIYTEVPIGGQKTISLSYQLKNPTNSNEGFDIVSLFEKQSGTDQDPLTFNLKNNTQFSLWDQKNKYIQTNNIEENITTIEDREFLFSIRR